MITLLTGLPGSGKTLFALTVLKAFADKNPGRGVYYSGINELTLPWINIGGYLKNESDGVTREVIPEGAAVKGGGEWYNLPTGSIVVIDECQNYFRVRGNGQPVPRSVQEFETHRHRGQDIYLITQHPMLIDQNVRRLIERHYHVKRWFGLQRATVHEFSGVKTDVDKNVNGSQRHEFRYPRAAYRWYKSAEVHTVQARVPMRTYFLLVLPLLLAGLAYIFYAEMRGFITPQGIKERIEGKGAAAKDGQQKALPNGAPAGGVAPQKKMTVAEYVEQFKPRFGNMPHTAPVFDDVLKPVVAPTPSACVSEGERCACYTEQATAIDLNVDVCRQIVRRGYFQYWAQKPQQEKAAPARVTESVPASVRPQMQAVAQVEGTAVAQPDPPAAPEPSPATFVRVPDTSQWRFRQ